MLIARRGSHSARTADNRDGLKRQMRRRPTHSEEFSYLGTLATSTSGPWVHHEDVTIHEVRALLGTAGTSNTVVTVYVNGVSIGTVTLGSGDTNEATTFSEPLVADTDVVTVGITTVGTGSPADLTVLLRVA